jgi:hypothetical protein
VQRLVARQRRLREIGAGAGALDLGLQRGRGPALQDGERLAAPDRVAQIAGECDDPSFERRSDDARGVGIAFEEGRRLDRGTGTAGGGLGEADVRSGDLVRAQRDRPLGMGFRRFSLGRRRGRPAAGNEEGGAKRRDRTEHE